MTSGTVLEAETLLQVVPGGSRGRPYLWTFSAKPGKDSSGDGAGVLIRPLLGALRTSRTRTRVDTYLQKILSHDLYSQSLRHVFRCQYCKVRDEGFCPAYGTPLTFYMGYQDK